MLLYERRLQLYETGTRGSELEIGYHQLQRPMQKPIYRRDRVVLRGGALNGSAHLPQDTESASAFINANEVYPGIIITQCPMLGPPHDASETETLTAWKQMIIEQEVDLVVQLHPYLSATSSNDCGGRPAIFCQIPCLDWVGEVFSDESHPLAAGVEEVSRLDIASQSLVQYTYRIGGRSVRHWWFAGWQDFEVPTGDGVETVKMLSQEIAQTVSRGGKVVLVCYAGRGRSGTLVALSIAQLHRLSNNNMTSKKLSTESLVKTIVKIREARDGLVETPQQFHFIREVLQITGASTTSQSPTRMSIYGIVVALIVLTITVGYLRKRINFSNKAKQRTS